MAPKGRTVDLIDKLSFPFFALAIGAEYLALKNREKRALGLSRVRRHCPWRALR